jgi:WD40 repeat protein
MHRGTINNFALSANLKYLFTVGRENFVKVWDYEFSIKGPGSNQVFIGHSEAVSNVCVYNDQMVITGGGEEGIFVWSFLGNTGKNDRMFNL